MRATRLLTVLLVCFLLGIVVSPAYAAPITVDTLVDGLGVPGCSLREAIANANADTALRGCAGGSGDDTITLSVSGPYTLTGGTTLNIQSTIIIEEAVGISALISGGSAVRVFTLNATGNLTLNGLDVLFGYNANNGGCIYVPAGASLSFNDGSLQDCTSDSNGGAIGTVTGAHTISISNSLLQNNRAGLNGGALYQLGTTPSLTISGSSFVGNRSGATAAASANGGAVLYSATDTGAVFSISGTTFSGNWAQANGGTVGQGGAIDVSLTNVTGTISGSTFTNNQALDGTTNNRGGAIYKGGTSALNISGSVFTGNTTSGPLAQGGAIFNAAGDMSVTSSRIQTNTAAVNGDAYYTVSAASDSITGSCIVDNGDTAVVDTNATNAMNATGNWWGSSYGPQIPARPSTTSSFVSNGDSISGNGVANVNVGLVNPGSTDPILEDVLPTGNWLTVVPTVAGEICNVCTQASSIGRARFCS